jgi:hypothetical protein
LKEKGKKNAMDVRNDEVEENFITSEVPQRRVAEKNKSKLKE